MTVSQHAQYQGTERKELIGSQPSFILHQYLSQVVYGLCVEALSFFTLPLGDAKLNSQSVQTVALTSVMLSLTTDTPTTRCTIPFDLYSISSNLLKKEPK